MHQQKLICYIEEDDVDGEYQIRILHGTTKTDLLAPAMWMYAKFIIARTTYSWNSISLFSYVRAYTRLLTSFFIGEYDDYDDDGDGYEQGKLICFIGHDQLSEFLSGITLRENKGYYSF